MPEPPATPRLVSGAGAFGQLGALAAELGFERTLLVADPGIVAAGYAERARNLLGQAGVESHLFAGLDVNPDSAMVEAGRAFAAPRAVDSIVALGGGSTLDGAKGINFVLTNGGRIQDYRGYGKPTQPMLPMIGVPTTSGTGSEAQSYAVISDAETRVKMACGAPGAAFRIALLDPLLTLTAPAPVRAQAGYDAVSHAVESYVSAAGNAASQQLSLHAWRLLNANFELVMMVPEDREAQEKMQLGAYYAGAAIEHSMLGATHACANPLSARYGTVHGVAIALLLTHVVRWNWEVAAAAYRQLHPDLLARLEEMAETCGLPRRLRDEGVAHAHLPELAAAAAEQWTGRYNPRPFDVAGALEIYEWAY